MDLMTILKTGGAFVVCAIAATYLLPRDVQVDRTAVLPVAPDAVLALAASTDGFQQFNPYLTADPALKIEGFGPAAGVGAGFRFDGKDGTGTQTIAAVSESAVTYHIDLGAMGQPVQTIRAVPVADGTEVTWSVSSDMGLNPVFRVFGLFLDGMMGPTFEQGLANLAEAAA